MLLSIEKNITTPSTSKHNDKFERFFSESLISPRINELVLQALPGLTKTSYRPRPMQLSRASTVDKSSRMESTSAQTLDSTSKDTTQVVQALAKLQAWVNQIHLHPQLALPLSRTRVGRSTARTAVTSPLARQAGRTPTKALTCSKNLAKMATRTRGRRNVSVAPPTRSIVVSSAPVEKPTDRRDP